MNLDVTCLPQEDFPDPKAIYTYLSENWPYSMEKMCFLDYFSPLCSKFPKIVINTLQSAWHTLVAQ